MTVGGGTSLCDYGFAARCTAGAARAEAREKRGRLRTLWHPAYQAPSCAARARPGTRAARTWALARCCTRCCGRPAFAGDDGGASTASRRPPTRSCRLLSPAQGLGALAAAARPRRLTAHAVADNSWVGPDRPPDSPPERPPHAKPPHGRAKPALSRPLRRALEHVRLGLAAVDRLALDQVALVAFLVAGAHQGRRAHVAANAPSQQSQVAKRRHRRAGGDGGGSGRRPRRRRPPRSRPTGRSRPTRRRRRDAAAQPCLSARRRCATAQPLGDITRKGKARLARARPAPRVAPPQPPAGSRRPASRPPPCAAQHQAQHHEARRLNAALLARGGR